MTEIQYLYLLLAVLGVLCLGLALSMAATHSQMVRERQEATERQG